MHGDSYAARRVFFWVCGSLWCAFLVDMWVIESRVWTVPE